MVAARLTPSLLAVSCSTSRRANRVSSSIRKTSGKARGGIEIEGEPFPPFETLIQGGKRGIRIIVCVLAGCPLMQQPGAEAGRDDPRGGFLGPGGADRKIIGVFVLGVSAVSPHPGKLTLVKRQRLCQGPPQLQVFDHAGFALPSPGDPPVQPFPNSLHQILRVGDPQYREQDRTN